MKILITGGAGFLGSHLISELENRGHTVAVVDNLSTGRRENLAGTGATLFHADINDPQVGNLVRECEVVFHLAAVTSVQESESDPRRAIEINTLATLKLAQWSAEAGVRRFVFFSSAAVYGEPERVPTPENFPVAPKNIYGMTKFDGEVVLRIAGEKYGLPWTAIRAFNAYGPRQRVDSQYAAVIPAFITAILREEPIKIFGDGHQTRDFVFAPDVAKIAADLAEHDGAVGKIINLGTGVQTSILALADKIAEIMGVPSHPKEFLPPKKEDIRHSAADISLLKSLGLAPRTPLDEGLSLTVQYFAERFRR